MNPEHTALTDLVEQILRSRGYDEYPAGEDLFEEMLDEVDAAVRKMVT